MKPCPKCCYAALCAALGGAGTLAVKLSEGRYGKQCERTKMKIQYDDGRVASIVVTRAFADFFKKRPHNCRGIG